MSRPKTNEKATMTVSIDLEYYEFLKNVSYRLSVVEKKKIGLSDLVRRALDIKFPHPIKK